MSEPVLPHPTIDVVIVVHDSAHDLPRTLPPVGAQLRDGDRLVVVDSGSTDGSAAAARDAAPHATVVEAPGNVGFAAGCNLGVQHGTGDLVLLLNPDAVPQDGCLDALRGAAARHPDWGAWQALVVLDDGRHVNTSGNLVHWLGFGWAGGLDTPVDAVDPAERAVGFGSGAALVVRRADWEALGGFDPRFFMYCEDLDLGLRLRLAGRETGIVPSAVVHHDYTFTKGDYKWFYLERNRWWTILSTYPGRLLALAAPGLLAFELALMAVAAREGWLPAKLRAQRAVLRELPQILARRRAVRRARRATTHAFAAGLTTSLDSPNLAAAHAVPGLAAAQRTYWTLGLKAVARPR